MSLHRIVDRLALMIALASSVFLLAIHENEAAIAALALWPLTRAAMSVLDVFFLFFTEKPLIRTSARELARGHRTN